MKRINIIYLMTFILAVVALVISAINFYYWTEKDKLEEELKKMMLKLGTCKEPYNEEERRLCSELMLEGKLG